MSQITSSLKLSINPMDFNLNSSPALLGLMPLFKGSILN